MTQIFNKGLTYLQQLLLREDLQQRLLQHLSAVVEDTVEVDIAVEDTVVEDTVEVDTVEEDTVGVGIVEEDTDRNIVVVVVYMDADNKRMAVTASSHLLLHMYTVVQKEHS